MNIAVITSGGDSPGMNPCVARIVTEASAKGHHVFGYRCGYRGILEKDFIALAPADVENWYKLGGTMLKTGRFPSLVEEAVQERLVLNLKEQKIEALIVIGGDGSFRGALALSRHDPRLNVVGIPGTIDNNVFGSQYTLGHDTALNKLVNYIDDISDTAMSLPGRVFFVETLGAFESYFPKAAVLMGMADFCVLYAPRTTNEEIVQKVAAFREGAERSYVLAVFAEESKQMFEAADLTGEKLKIKVRCNLLGFQQRGGVPTACDRMHAAGFARYALAAIEGGLFRKYTVYSNGVYGYRDLDDARQKKVFDNYGFD
ncbi:MAG: 6-phosphofructokinase [Treponema sp.]|jgi:6-phosphofructokinase 1|nr:6-phosphofructokinase [Treponema sp.]